MDMIGSRVKYFERIPAVPKREMILSRLGYRKGTTALDSGDLSLVEEGIRQGSCLCKPKGAYLLVPVASGSDAGILLDNGMSFQSQSLSKLLKDSHDIVLMAATVGPEIVETVFNAVQKGDAAKGLMMDSVASQTADAALDWIVHLLDSMLAREGKKLTKHRYSPGFGDLPLSYQKDIFEVLQLERLHMALTDKFMLIPEKSVIAIAGVEEKGAVNGQ